MKHFIAKKLAFLLCGVCLSFNLVYGQALPCHTDSIDLPTVEKLTIDLKDYIKEDTIVQLQRSRFKDRFKCQINRVDGKGPDTVDINTQGERIKMNALLELYTKSKTAAENYQKPKRKLLTATAFRIWFGLQDNNVRFFYQPVFLVGKRSWGKFRSQTHEIEGEGFYSYDAAQQKFIRADASAASYQSAYYNQILIKHGDKSKLDTMVMDTGWRGDSKGILFSFQEILDLYHRTFATETNGSRYCRELVVNNGAAEYRRRLLFGAVNPLQNTIAKHTVCISGVVDSAAGTGSVEALFAAPPGANLAHLCPPSCNSINYSVR